jgi:hypothetical protein
MKLFEYAVIYTPLQTKDQNERGEDPKSELVVDVTRTLAESEREAMMHASRAIPAQYADKLSQLDIAIRPF